MNGHVLEVRDLCVDYRDSRGEVIHALKNVSFHAGEGEIIGLIGESGSGKSTAVKALMGVLSYNAVMTKGDILYRGRSLTGTGFADVKEHQRFLNSLRGKEIAILFQQPADYMDPTMTVAEQIIESLAAHEKVPFGFGRKKAAEVLRKAGLNAGLLNRIPAQLSGGQAQRIAAAMAMVHDPSVLIADEPFASLDHESREYMSGLLSGYAASGKTVILVCHDIEAAASLCSRAYVFFDGEIIESGSLRKILSEPAEEYTKQLVEAYHIMKEEK